MLEPKTTVNMLTNLVQEKSQSEAGREVRSSIHIYSAGMQPAENFVDRTGDRPMRFKCSPLALRRCNGCGKVRRCKNLQVQVFYDGIRYWCKTKCNISS